MLGYGGNGKILKIVKIYSLNCFISSIPKWLIFRERATDGQKLSTSVGSSKNMNNYLNLYKRD